MGTPMPIPTARGNRVSIKSVGAVLREAPRLADSCSFDLSLHLIHRSDWRCGHTPKAAATEPIRPVKEPTMLHYAVVFLVIALIAAVLGFGGIAAGAAGIAKILFVVFLVMAVISFIFGFRRR